MWVEARSRLLPREHGGATATRTRSAPFLDFSSSVNPYGPCRKVLAAIRAAPVIDTRIRLPLRCVWLLPKVARPRRTPWSSATARPISSGRWRASFSDGAKSRWSSSRRSRNFARRPPWSARSVEECRGRAEHDFALEWSRLEERVRASQPAVVYLASPATPTGARVPVEEVAAFALAHPDVVFVLDQAFVSLSDFPGDERVRVPENVVRVRSLTKDHALAGLRLGYLLAKEEWARAIEAARPPWSTSSIAQAAGMAAVSDHGFVDKCRRRLLSDRDALRSDLAGLSLAIVSSVACFVAFRVRDSKKLADALVARRIIVRECTSFGLTGYVRVAARPASDRAALLAALSEELV